MKMRAFSLKIHTPGIWWDGRVKRLGRNAFSLTELLVAIVILAVLVALIFPGGRSVYRTAKQASCMNNLRSYGAAIYALVADRGSYPASSIDSVNFGEALVPAYLAQLPQCPLANKKERATHKDFSYGGNAALVFYYKSLKALPVPAGRVVLASEYYGKEGFNSASHFNMTMWGVANGHATDIETMKANEGKIRRAQYHGGETSRGLNLLFLDGSGKLIRPEKGNWRDPDIFGTADNNGYFFDRNHFRLMNDGKLKVP